MNTRVPLIGLSVKYIRVVDTISKLYYDTTVDDQASVDPTSSSWYTKDITLSMTPRHCRMAARCRYGALPLGWGFVALTKDYPSKISWMKWLQ